MGQYRFDLIDVKGGIAQSQFLTCADDLDALGKAEALSSVTAVDVWDGARRVLHVKHGNQIATPSDVLPG
jgi:hypothetical protein